NTDRPEVFAHFGDHILQIRRAGDVAGKKYRYRGAHVADFVHQLLAFLGQYVDKSHASALMAEGFHQRGAYTCGAAGNKYHFVLQTGINVAERHDSLNPVKM